jgi:alpha-maltose-1-phosphate synthase
MKVGSFVITPPEYKASGGVSAGMLLMKHVAAHVETHALLMSDKDATVVEDGLIVHKVRAHNPLARLRGLPRPLVNLFWTVDFGGWLDAVRPDIVHIHNPHPPLAFAAAARACRSRDIPYVITTHGFVEFNDYASASNAPSWQRPLFDRILRRPLADAARQAAKIFILSPEERPILKAMGVSSDRLAVVPNGVDLYFTEPVAEAERAERVRRFALPDDRPIILFVGNHTRNKGIDVLLQAISRMTEPAVAVIAGAIRSESEHRAMMANAGFEMASGRVLFTDYVARDELRALYLTADIFAFPSRADTLPLVILEAMACELPVIATRVGGIPFQVTAETGMLVEPGDPDQLAGALDALARNPELRRRFGRAGRERAINVFNWERSAAESRTIYVKALNGQVRARSLPASNQRRATKE